MAAKRKEYRRENVIVRAPVAEYGHDGRLRFVAVVSIYVSPAVGWVVEGEYVAFTREDATEKARARQAVLS